MDTQKIGKKFSRIHTISNTLFYGYGFFILVIILLLGAGYFSGGEFFGKNIHHLSEKERLSVIIILIWFFVSVILHFFLLHHIRKLTHNLKNNRIFTPENAKIIKKLFLFFAAISILIGAIFSGGILSFIIWIFIWILYEIFFIWFDYKVQNEILQEENKLTI